jgi:hypothetical protein
MKFDCSPRVVDRRKKWNALDVIPMEMRYEEVDWGTLRCPFARYCEAKVPKASTGINDYLRAVREA